jgi:organic hydroperoxide reductase OsmC/OhrA
MKISAQVKNSEGVHQVTLKTGESSHSIHISPKPSGFGSSANGGELLFLALATCYCNDIYREAGKRNIKVEKVEVDMVPQSREMAQWQTSYWYMAPGAAVGSGRK